MPLGAVVIQQPQQNVCLSRRLIKRLQALDLARRSLGKRSLATLCISIRIHVGKR